MTQLYESLKPFQSRNPSTDTREYAGLTGGMPCRFKFFEWIGGSIYGRLSLGDRMQQNRIVCCTLSHQILRLR